MHHIGKTSQFMVKNLKALNLVGVKMFRVNLGDENDDQKAQLEKLQFISEVYESLGST